MDSQSLGSDGNDSVGSCFQRVEERGRPCAVCTGWYRREPHSVGVVLSHDRSLVPEH